MRATGVSIKALRAVLRASTPPLGLGWAVGGERRPRTGVRTLRGLSHLDLCPGRTAHIHSQADFTGVQVRSSHAPRKFVNLASRAPGLRPREAPSEACPSPPVHHAVHGARTHKVHARRDRTGRDHRTGHKHVTRRTRSQPALLTTPPPARTLSRTQSKKPTPAGRQHTRVWRGTQPHAHIGSRASCESN